MPEKEKANNCLSTNKGLPKGEGTHSTNQDQSCNSDWVYDCLAMAKQTVRNRQKKEPKVCRGPEALAHSKRPHQQAHKESSHRRRGNQRLPLLGIRASAQAQHPTIRDHRMPI